MKVHVSVKQIFITHFNINESQFDWNVPLEELDNDFKTLSFLVYLEQLVDSKFKTKVSIIEKINTSIHTPTDLIYLIKKEL